MTSDLEDIQIRLMELTKTVEDLNDTVIEQSKQIRFLEQKTSNLEAQLMAIDPASSGSVTLGNEVPPHY